MEKSRESYSDKRNENSIRPSTDSCYSEVDKGDKKVENEIKINEVPKKYIYDFKIIIIGAIGVGKTSIIERYISNKFIVGERMSISCEIQEKTIDLDSETKVNLKIVDTAGEERYMSLPNQYFKDCQGAIIMYDITEKNSFNKIKDWLNILKEKAPEKIVIMLAGNKSDLYCLKADLEDELNPYKEKYKHYEISAKTGNNISLIFEDLAKKIVEILKNKGEEEIVEKRNSNILEPQKKKKGVFKKIKKVFSKC
jgi:small GTP-binding protein